MPFKISFPEIEAPIQHVDRGLITGVLRVAVPTDFSIWERHWEPFLRNRPDGAWPWARELQHADTTDGALCVALLDDASLHGLLSLTTGGEKSRVVPGADIVYIEYLGIAPEDQHPPVGRRAARGIGTTLLAVAVDLALDLGLEGRVGLHSKDDALGFYRGRVTEFTRESTPDGDLIYFETSPADAERLSGA